MVACHYNHEGVRLCTILYRLNRRQEYIQIILFVLYEAHHHHRNDNNPEKENTINPDCNDPKCRWCYILVVIAFGACQKWFRAQSRPRVVCSHFPFSDIPGPHPGHLLNSLTLCRSLIYSSSFASQWTACECRTPYSRRAEGVSLLLLCRSLLLTTTDTTTTLDPSVTSTTPLVRFPFRLQGPPAIRPILPPFLPILLRRGHSPGLPVGRLQRRRFCGLPATTRARPRTL